ncbi:MAG: sensor histidine kinase [Bacteroidales bacterium]|nr:MAG: sensor histidine kinase [Bacteroidales bacterium]
MNRKKIFLIIALMGLSITGITLMQVHWMLKTIKLNEENFDRAVNETLTLVVDKLEKEKDIKFSMPFQENFWFPRHEESSNNEHKEKPRYDKRFFAFPKHYSKTKFNNYGLSHFNKERTNFSKSDCDTNEISIAFDSTFFDEHDPYKAYEQALDSIEELEQFEELIDPSSLTFTRDYIGDVTRTVKVVKDDTLSRIIIISNGRYDTISSEDLPKSLIPPPPPPPTGVERVQIRNRTNPYVVWGNSMSTSRSNRRMVHRDTNNHYRFEEEVIALNEKEIEEQTQKQELALKQLVYEMDARKMELKDRVNFEELKNLLAVELKNKGLVADFEFALVNKDSERKEVFTTPLFNKISAKSIYNTRLFPNNFVPLNDFLEMKFPNKDNAIYKSVILPISASLFFTLIVFLTFTITLVTIIKQKKLAEMKADFINNMTHELKTPIATISLASDSIDNPKVVEKPETVKYFTAIIREENSRMNKLVESVLQTARLERKTLKLNLKEVNLSKLTEKIADQMKIQAKAKEGSILFTKPEEDIFIIADENLMENVIFNLIDNAIKYSLSKPDVRITLKNLPGGISLSVEDNGIGMSRSEQHRVFEKFYRISQGDVHNIKGFGLGLSNVKEITELHGGMVQLRSEIGKGSTFSLFFPNKVNGNE